MNTLLGEIATLNDVQFPRYRLAFKFRKLQKNFLLDHADLGGVQDVLHAVGVQGLRRDSEVPLSQLRTAVSELYTSLRMSHPALGSSQVQQAQELCLNWLMMAFQCSAGHKVYAGALKMTLCLFCGAKTNEKARYIFSMLANTNGAVEKEGIRYFCKVTKQLAWCLHEQPYIHYSSLDAIFQECLVFVRSAEDVEDEELDGGIRRQWLSQFEFMKLFTASPEPHFISWLRLWYRLPIMEKVVHPVRCMVCTRKPIVCFRYTCTHCPNFHLCQMCFLKGRTSDRHPLSHVVMEFSSSSKAHKSWRHRLLGMPAKTNLDGHIMNEKREPFVFTNGTRPTSFEDVDTPQTSLNEMLSNSQQGFSTSKQHPSTSHQPAIIRIGSADSNGKNTTKHSASPKKGARSSSSSPLHPSPHSSPLHLSPVRHVSVSPDSLSSRGSKQALDDDDPTPRSSIENLSTASGSGSQPEVAKELVLRRTYTSASDSAVLESEDPAMVELRQINKRLSMEVDQLLSELPSSPPSFSSRTLPSRTLPNRTLHTFTYPTHTLPSHTTFSTRPPDATLSGSLHKLQAEEQALQSQVNQLTDKREKLAHELHDLMAHVQHLHFGFETMSNNGVRTPSINSLNGMSAPVAPVHIRCDSAPIEAYPCASSPSRNPLYCGKNGSCDYTTAPPLLDPLADFTPGANPDGHRLSVAW